MPIKLCISSIFLHILIKCSTNLRQAASNHSAESSANSLLSCLPVSCHPEGERQSLMPQNGGVLTLQICNRINHQITRPSANLSIAVSTIWKFGSCLTICDPPIEIPSAPRPWKANEVPNCFLSSWKRCSSQNGRLRAIHGHPTIKKLHGALGEFKCIQMWGSLVLLGKCVLLGRSRKQQVLEGCPDPSRVTADFLHTCAYTVAFVKGKVLRT